MSASVSLSIAANSAIAASKLVGFLATGSPTLFAETVHSAADVSNQVLSKAGEVRARGRASELHPFGLGQERYFWALVSAVSVYFVGCGVSVYHGVRALLRPAEVEAFGPLAVGLLLFALVLALITLGVAWREIGGRAGMRENLAGTTVLAVLLEDAVALVGILLALLVAGTSWAFGPHPALDASVSILVGLMLGAMAIVLAAINRRLLADAADPRLDAAVEKYLHDGGIEARVSSILLDAGRAVLFVRVDQDAMHGRSFAHSWEIGEAIKRHFRAEGKARVDAVYWKFPVRLE